MNFPKLIKEKRLSLQESQRLFGQRFKKSSTAVSLWEANKRQAPYNVLDFVLDGNGEVSIKTCPTCKGKGIVRI